MKKVIIIVMLLLIVSPTIQAKSYSKKECKQYAYTLILKKGWSVRDYNNLVKL